MSCWCCRGVRQRAALSGSAPVCESLSSLFLLGHAHGCLYAMSLCVVHVAYVPACSAGLCLSKLWLSHQHVDPMVRRGGPAMPPLSPTARCRPQHQWPWLMCSSVCASGWGHACASEQQNDGNCTGCVLQSVATLCLPLLLHCAHLFGLQPYNVVPCVAAESLQRAAVPHSPQA